MKRVPLLAALLALAAPTAVDAQGNEREKGTLQKHSKRAQAELRRTEHRQKLALRRAEQQRQRERRAAERTVRLAAQREIRTARGYRKLVVKAEDVRPAVEKLATLDWQSDLTSAQRLARKTGKPIVWIHALGDLRGVL